MKNFLYSKGKSNKKTKELYIETIDKKPPTQDRNVRKIKKRFLLIAPRDILNFNRKTF